LRERNRVTSEQQIARAPIAVDYDLTVEDRAEFSVFYQGHSRTLQKMLRNMMLLGAGLVASLGAFGGLNLFNVVFTSLMVGLFALFVVLTQSDGQKKRTYRRLLAEGRNHAILGRHRIVLDDTSVVCTNAMSESRLQWPAIEHVVAGPEAAYLYTSAASAFIVPRRAFPSPQAFAEFVATAQRLRAAALAGPPPRPLLA
jgi:hypothetical protein